MIRLSPVKKPKRVKDKKAVLKLQNVCREFKLDGETVHALSNISFTIQKGELLAIIGPSGSGKSTLMYLMGCLDTPSKGEILIDGEKVSGLSERQLARVRNEKIGFVFQQFSLLARTPALANVELPLIYAGVKGNQRKKTAKKMLEKVSLGDRLYHLPNQLSGGQQQRVAIARALINHPAIILADEPTGNLDSKSGEDIIKFLQSLNKQGNTVVIVTHDLDVAKKTNRIITLKDGKILSDKNNF